MEDVTSDLKAAGRRLHHQALAADSSALRRLRVLDDWKRRSDSEIAAGVRRRHVLSALARELGFRGWQHATAVLRGSTEPDFGKLLCPPRCQAHFNIWCAAYDEASSIRAERDGYLLAYRRDFVVVDEHYIATLGLDSDALEWERIGRDWVRPRDPAARRRLYRQLIRHELDRRSIGAEAC